MNSFNLNASLEHDSSLYSSFSNTSTMPPPNWNTPSMNPTAQMPHSRRAYSFEEWESQKHEITRLYVDENMPLQSVKGRKSVMKTMEEEYGFFATKKQYKDRIAKWGLDKKNVKGPEMKEIVRKKQQRKINENKESGFRISGREVELEKIDRFMKRKGIPENTLYWPSSPAASTSSAISYYTPSAGDSLTPHNAPSPAHPISPRMVLSDGNIDSPRNYEHTSATSPATAFYSKIGSVESAFTGQSPAPFPMTIAASKSQTQSSMGLGCDPARHIYDESNYMPSYLDIELPNPSPHNVLVARPDQFWPLLPGDNHFHRIPMDMDTIFDTLISGTTEVVAGPILNEVAVQSLGRYRQTEENRLRQELDHLELVYGKDHQETLDILAALGEVLVDQGRYKSAERLYRREAIARRKENSDNDNGTLRAFRQLGRVWLHQGRYLDAEKMCLRTMEREMEILGGEHPNTLTSMGNLAVTYYEQGRWKEAEELELLVKERRTRVLGEEHPSTLTSMGNLASTYRKQGRWKEAEELQLLVKERTTRVLGEEHPNTLRSMVNLAVTYYEQGRWKEAEELQLLVKERRTRVLGEEHPDTLRSMGNLALTYREQGRWKEAEALDLLVKERNMRAKRVPTL